MEGDRHLRSASEVLTYVVQATDGDLGELADFIMEDANWFIRYLVVRAGSWLNGQNLLLSTQLVGSISWSDRQIVLVQSRAEM